MFLFLAVFAATHFVYHKILSLDTGIFHPIADNEQFQSGNQAELKFLELKILGNCGICGFSSFFQTISNMAKKVIHLTFAIVFNVSFRATLIFLCFTNTKSSYC